MGRRTRWVPIALGIAIGGCGGSSEAKKPRSADIERTKGEKCLDDAAIRRQPKPNAPAKIQLSHILVRHMLLKRPQGAKLAPEEACLRALEALEKLQGGAEWDEVEAEYSDAKGPNKGWIGMVSHDQLDPAFADAAFALDVNELSYVVESERGFHIILRSE